VPPGLAFSLAALLWFYRGRTVAGVYTGTREAGPYPIHDDAAVIARMEAAWAAGDPAHAAAALLGDAALWGEDLAALPGLAGLVTADLSAIAAKGMPAALVGIAARLAGPA
jgi:tagaturonate reductase